MDIRTMIFDAPDLQLMRLGDGPKDNLRLAYQVALQVDNKQPHMVESADKMFHRTGAFIWAYIETLNQIVSEFYQRCGLTGGVTGPASLDDIKFLSEPDALELFNLTFAQVSAETFKRDLLSEMISWAAKKKELNGLGTESKEEDNA